MRLEQTDYDNAETGCCAKLDSKRWDGREIEWKDKPFLKDHVRSILYVPLNYGSVLRRDHAAVQRAEAYADEPLCLTDEVSPWGADVYLAVDREIPEAKIERLTGKFLTKVFEGPYRHAAKWAREMETYAKRQGHTPQRLYFYYATCPKCAKRYGKNQVVVFAQIAGPEAFPERREPRDHAATSGVVAPDAWPGDSTPGWDVVDEASWESFPASDPPAYSTDSPLKADADR